MGENDKVKNVTVRKAMSLIFYLSAQYRSYVVYKESGRGRLIGQEDMKLFRGRVTHDAEVWHEPSAC